MAQPQNTRSHIARGIGDRPHRLTVRACAFGPIEWSLNALLFIAAPYGLKVAVRKRGGAE
jgi:hypothetical protein